MNMKSCLTTCAILVALSLAGAASPAAETSVTDLIAALKSADESVRLHAMDHLADRGAEAAPAVEPLTALLKDKSAAVRAHAAHALGQIGPAAKPAVPALVELVKDEDPVVRGQAVKAVIAIRPGPEVTVPLCVELLEKSDPAVQHRILAAISAAGPATVPALIEALKDEKAAYWACIILRDMGPDGKAAIPALAERLKDSRPEVRREAVLALGGMGEAAADVVPQIAAVLSDKHAAVAATYALGRIGNLPEKVDAAIEKNSKGDDKMLGATSLWALANTHPDDKALRARVTEQLIGRLSDDDPFVRVVAARGLASLPPAPDVTLPIWERALKDADETTLAHALDALARLGAPAVPLLANALEHQEVRSQVLLVIGKIGPDAAAAAPQLAGLIDDEDERTARSAVLALAAIGPDAKVAVPALVNALEQREDSNSHAVAYALGKIGPAAGAAQDELIKLLTGENQDLALISAWALMKINPSQAAATKAVPVFVAGLDSPAPLTRRGAAESLGELGPLAKPAVPALERAAKDSDPAVREAATRALAAARG